MENKFTLGSMDLASMGAKHVPVPMRKITVKVGTANLDGFNQAFIREANRKNPLKAKEVNLTADELARYEQFLLDCRVRLVNDTCRNFRQIKRLAMPSFVERILSDVGRVTLRNQAIDIWPVADSSDMTIEEAFAISDKIEAFMDDLAVVVGAMPAQPEGNVETMTVVLIQDYVVGMGDTEDPLVEYIVYALGSVLQEKEFENLYFLRYDDVRTIECNMSALGGVLARG